MGVHLPSFQRNRFWDDNHMLHCEHLLHHHSFSPFFVGFAIFSVIGFMVHEQGVSVGSVADGGGLGLVFIAYPKGVAQMPGAAIWAVLFFIVILSPGLGSQFVAVKGFVTAVVDMFPRFLRKGNRREYFIFSTCLVSFLIGLSMVSRVSSRK